MINAILHRFGLHLGRDCYRKQLAMLETAQRYAPSSILGIVVEAAVAAGHRLCFAQVGANDGVEADPLHAMRMKHKLPGVFVEPVPSTFKRLVKNFDGVPGLHFEQVAVAPEPGSLTLHCLVDPADETLQLANGISSDRPWVQHQWDKLKVSDPLLAERLRLETIPVPCITLQDLFAKYPDPAINVLLIDVEGLDCRLVAATDWSVVRPAIVHFEHANVDPDEQRAAFERLGSQGYRLLLQSRDCLAVLPDFFPEQLFTDPWSKSQARS